MDEENVELAEQLAKWEEKEILDAYETMNLQNPYALVGSSADELFQSYIQMPLEDLRELYRIKLYKQAIRKEQSK